jgi:LPS export ABC transporter protein LptC
MVSSTSICAPLPRVPNLMKRRLRMTIIGVVVLLLGGVGALVGHSLWEQSKDDVVKAGVEFLPGVSQHIQDFHRVKVQDGRKVWEVSAQDAQYVDEEKTVVVRDAKMELFLKDGRSVGLSGEEARIVLDGREVSRVELHGEIEVTLADYVVRTERATYDQNRQLISTPGAVEITGRAVQLHGDRMELEVLSERLTLRHHIAMQIKPALLNQDGREAPL